MTDINRIPLELIWVADDGSHESFLIGEIVRTQAAQIEHLQFALREIETKGRTTGYGRVALAYIARAALRDN